MSDTTFHLVEATTGKFVRVHGSPGGFGDYYLSLDENDPVFATNDIVDIHRLMKIAESEGGPIRRMPYGIPSVDDIEGEFYPVTVAKTYGTIVPGGDPILLSNELKRVELVDTKEPKTVHSRRFDETPRAVLKVYLPSAIVESLEGMEPEFIVVDRRAGSVSVGDFVLSGTSGFGGGPKLGEILHVQPLPDSWPLPRETDESCLDLVFLNNASASASYTLEDLPLAQDAGPSPRF